MTHLIRLLAYSISRSCDALVTNVTELLYPPSNFRDYGNIRRAHYLPTDVPGGRYDFPMHWYKDFRVFDLLE